MLAANELVNRRSEVNNLKNALKDKKEALSESVKTIAEQKKKFESLGDKSISLEARTKQVFHNLI
jgi:hypothetical protein